MNHEPSYYLVTNVPPMQLVIQQAGKPWAIVDKHGNLTEFDEAECRKVAKESADSQCRAIAALCAALIDRERERCAKLCEEATEAYANGFTVHDEWPDPAIVGGLCAEAIRREPT